MNPAVLIAYGGYDSYRERSLAQAVGFWETNFPSWLLRVRRDDAQPFAKARVQNQAVRSLSAEIDLLVFADADSLLTPEHVLAAVELAGEAEGPVLGFDRYCRLSRAATDNVFSRRPIGEAPIEWELSGSGSHGLMVIQRRSWLRVGGLDEKFVGWASEDLAFDLLCEAYWPLRRVQGTIYHLWHPRPPGSDGGPPGGPFEQAGRELYEMYRSVAEDRQKLQNLHDLSPSIWFAQHDLPT